MPKQCWIPAQARVLIDGVEDFGLRMELERIYLEHPDGKGRRKREINTSPMPGSHRYKWLRKPRPNQEVRA